MPSEKINLDSSPYDLSTFSGRLSHFVRLTSPLNLLVSNSELKAARQLLDNYKKDASKVRVTPTELWNAKYALDSSVNADDGEPIFMPFRMSAFVPTNLVITLGLLIPNPTIKTVIFWQWLNQSLNVGINWANANKTTVMSVEETAIAYGTAVTSSVGVAVGLGRFVQSTSLLSNTSKIFLGRFVPFVAVATAGCLNVFLMRRKELVDGIAVKDDDGKVVGKSKIAGWTAVSQVAISRIATAFPALTLPPLVLSQLEKMDYFKKSQWRLLSANFALITLSLMTALPAAIALFPQYGSLPVAKLEPEFQKLKRKDGSPVTKVHYNKGL